MHAGFRSGGTLREGCAGFGSEQKCLARSRLFDRPGGDRYFARVARNVLRNFIHADLWSPRSNLEKEMIQIAVLNLTLHAVSCRIRIFAPLLDGPMTAELSEILQQAPYWP